MTGKATPTPHPPPPTHPTHPLSTSVTPFPPFPPLAALKSEDCPEHAVCLQDSAVYARVQYPGHGIFFCWMVLFQQVRKCGQPLHRSCSQACLC
jgi:hypothetical protein